MDAINGGAGNDYVYGGLGADVLTGSTGYDGFVFNVAASSGIDCVSDFSTFYDTIWLENAVFTALATTGTLAAPPSIAAPQRTIRRTASSTTPLRVLSDTDGTGATALVQFATLRAGLGLTASDFSVY